MRPSSERAQEGGAVGSDAIVGAYSLSRTTAALSERDPLLSIFLGFTLTLHPRLRPSAPSAQRGILATAQRISRRDSRIARAGCEMVFLRAADSRGGLITVWNLVIY